MSACMSGTRGSGVLSSTGDVLLRGVGGVCDMCMCLARAVWVDRGVSGRENWVWALPILWGQGECWTCVCFGCGGVGGVGGEWVGGLDQGRERWGGVMPISSLCRWQVKYLCIVLGGYLHI